MVTMVRIASGFADTARHPNAASTTYNHAPISEAAPFHVPRRTNSMGRLQAMSRMHSAADCRRDADEHGSGPGESVEERLLNADHA